MVSIGRFSVHSRSWFVRSEYSGPDNTTEMLTSIGSMAGEIMARIVRYLGKFPSDVSHACPRSCYIALVRASQSFRLPPHYTRSEMLEHIYSNVIDQEIE